MTARCVAIKGVRGRWVAQVEGRWLAVLHENFWVREPDGSGFYRGEIWPEHRKWKRLNDMLEALRLNKLVVMQRDGEVQQSGILSHRGYTGVFNFDGLQIDADAFTLRITSLYALRDTRRSENRKAK